MHRLDRDKANSGMTMPRQDDLFACLGAADEIGQLFLRIIYGYLHGWPALCFFC
jgi:hypothetical protein